jgi:hypothetical protein
VYFAFPLSSQLGGRHAEKIGRGAEWESSAKRVPQIPSGQRHCVGSLTAVRAIFYQRITRNTKTMTVASLNVPHSLSHVITKALTVRRNYQQAEETVTAMIFSAIDQRVLKRGRSQTTAKEQQLRRNKMTAKQKYTDKPEEETALIASARRQGGVAPASAESKYLVELFASVKERMWKPDLDLETIRDIVEHLQLAATRTRGGHLH